MISFLSHWPRTFWPDKFADEIKLLGEAVSNVDKPAPGKLGTVGGLVKYMATTQLNSTQGALTDAGVKHLDVRIYVTLLCKQELIRR